MSSSAGAGDPEPVESPSSWQIVLDTILGVPLIMPIVFVVTLPLLFYKAWVITILWKWFVMPVFSLPPLPFGYACGLLLMFYCLTVSGVPPKYPKEEARVRAVVEFIGSIIGSTGSLAAGWIVKAICALNI
jgi:hypothetical protein